MVNKNTLENIKISLRAIKSQPLRAILTMLVIGFGIMALVGILTTIDALKGKLTEEFSSMGSNTFTVRNWSFGMRKGRHGGGGKSYPSITFEDARKFREQFVYPGITSISTNATMTATVKYESEKTNPNVRIIGTDDDYLITSGYALSSGRNFSPNEIKAGNHVAIIGSDIQKKVFPEAVDPLGKVIAIGSAKYKVIGILKEKGNSMGFSGDNQCLITLSNVRQYYGHPDMSYSINVLTYKTADLEPAINEATGLMRIIRKVAPGQENSFQITKSDNLANLIIDQISVITIIATAIGLITLLVAAIGLLNIMLVSVTERTREIGTRKAIGASSATIRQQFFIEAILIGQMGGVLGIILGITFGNVAGMLLEAPFVVPWNWMIFGSILCLLVGLASGYYPAKKAASLDPIEALRHE